MKWLFPIAAALSALSAAGAGWRQARQLLPERATNPGPRVTKVHSPVDPGARKSPLPSTQVPDRWTVWQDKLRQAASTADLAALAMEVAAIEPYLDRSAVLQLLCARWAEVDPAGGLAWWAQEKPKGLESLRVVLLTEWVLLDLEQAWSHLSLEPDEAEWKRDAALVGEVLLLENQERFWAWFQKAGIPLPPGGKPSAAWLTLARRHQAALEAKASELAAVPKDETTLLTIPVYSGLYQLLAWLRAERDPAAAMAWAQSTPDEVRNACLAAVLPLLAKTDPAAAARELAAMRLRLNSAEVDSGDGRSGTVVEIGKEMARTDPKAAVEWIAKLPDESGDVNVMAIAEIMRSSIRGGQLSIRGAFELICNQESEGEMIRLNVLPNMWEGIPPEQLKETAAWLKDSNPSLAESKGWALAGLVGEWAKTDPQAAMAFASQAGDAGLRQEIFGTLLSPALYSRKPGALADFLAIVPPADRAAAISEQVRMRYGDGMLEHGDFGGPDFQGQVIADALVQTPAGETRYLAAKRVFTAWGSLDPDAALAWTAAQPDPQLRQAALMATMEGWSKYDAWAASQWLAEQPRGPDRDAATHQLARSLREVEPDSAWTWASDIGDETVRLEARAAVLRKWRDSDAEAARAAVSSLTGLTPAAQQIFSDTLAGKDN